MDNSITTAVQEYSLNKDDLIIEDFEEHLDSQE